MQRGNRLPVELDSDALLVASGYPAEDGGDMATDDVTSPPAQPAPAAAVRSTSGSAGIRDAF